MESLGFGLTPRIHAWMGVQERVIQARGVSWPFYVWFIERDQTYCCDVLLDSLLASTVKAWVLELDIELGFYR